MYSHRIRHSSPPAVVDIRTVPLLFVRHFLLPSCGGIQFEQLLVLQPDPFYFAKLLLPVLFKASLLETSPEQPTQALPPASMPCSVLDSELSRTLRTGGSEARVLPE